MDWIGALPERDERTAGVLEELEAPRGCRERQAEDLVFGLRPARADPHFGPASTDEIERLHGARQDHGVADGDRRHHGAESHGRGDRSKGKQEGDRVEESGVFVESGHRHKVVRRIEGVETQFLAQLNGLPDLRPGQARRAAQGVTHVAASQLASSRGSCFIPLKKFEATLTGGPLTRRRESSGRSSSKTTRASRRARCAPRQWCGPPAPSDT
jgi:hypothetical protein